LKGLLERSAEEVGMRRPIEDNDLEVRKNKEKEEEIERLKGLLERSAQALEKWNMRERFSELISELRKELLK
jgi:uncharacterized protein YaiL (DUF2058 family)